MSEAQRQVPLSAAAADMVQAMRLLTAAAPVFRRALEDVAAHGRTAEVRRDARRALASMGQGRSQTAAAGRTAGGRAKGRRKG